MNMTIFRKILDTIPVLASVLLAGIILSGCSGNTNFTDGDTQKRNEVQMIKIPFMINFKKGSPQLSSDSVEQLDTFMTKVDISYADELSMDFPLQKDGKLSAQNRKRMDFLSHLLKKRGLRLSSMITPYGASPTENQARLLISRYIVTPPTCGNWSQESTDNFRNAPSANFGCANQANLGLMVANPRDLIIGESTNSSYTESSAKAVYTYRTKKPRAFTSSTTTSKSK